MQLGYLKLDQIGYISGYDGYTSYETLIGIRLFNHLSTLIIL
jgi:hypothetical protein